MGTATRRHVDYASGVGFPCQRRWHLSGRSVQEHDQPPRHPFITATWAKRYREAYTVHLDDKVVATATYKHTTMEAA